MKKLLRLEKLVNFDVWMKFAKRGDALFINHGSIEVGHSIFFFLRLRLDQSKQTMKMLLSSSLVAIYHSYASAA